MPLHVSAARRAALWLALLCVSMVIAGCHGGGGSGPLPSVKQQHRGTGRSARDATAQPAPSPQTICEVTSPGDGAANTQKYVCFLQGDSASGVLSIGPMQPFHLQPGWRCSAGSYRFVKMSGGADPPSPLPVPTGVQLLPKQSEAGVCSKEDSTTLTFTFPSPLPPSQWAVHYGVLEDFTLCDSVNCTNDTTTITEFWLHPQLRIINSDNHQEIQNTQWSRKVDQQVNIRAGSPWDFVDLSNCNWSVPYGYSPYAYGSLGTPPSPMPPTTNVQSLSFYWVQGFAASPLSLTCTASGTNGIGNGGPVAPVQLTASLDVSVLGGGHASPSPSPSPAPAGVFRQGNDSSTDVCKPSSQFCIIAGQTIDAEWTNADSSGLQDTWSVGSLPQGVTSDGFNPSITSMPHKSMQNLKADTSARIGTYQERVDNTFGDGTKTSGNATIQILCSVNLHTCPHIDEMYLVQATQVSKYTKQPTNSTVNLVAGRDTVVRVFVKGDGTQTPPPMRVDIGSQSYNVPPPNMLPATLDKNVEANGLFSYNYLIPGNAVPSGSISATATILDANRNKTDEKMNRSFTAVSVPALSVTMLPVWVSVNDRGNRSTYYGLPDNIQTSFFRRIYPLKDVNFNYPGNHVTVRGRPPTSAANGNYNMLQALLHVRAYANRNHAHAYTNVFYGAVPAAAIASGSETGQADIGGVAGVSYDSTAIPAVALSAVGWRVYAHEMGHMFGLRHVPGCGAAGPDPNYPYTDTTIGVNGMDPTHTPLEGAVQPYGYNDVMTYCYSGLYQVWISDYDWRNVLQNRGTAAAAPAALMHVAEANDAAYLRVSGVITSEGPNLNPVYRTSDVESTPSGPFTLVGKDKNGGVLISVPFAAQAAAEGGMTFEVVVRVSRDVEVRLASWEVIANGQTGVLSRTQAHGIPQVAARDAGNGIVDLEWDDTLWPEAEVYYGSPPTYRDSTVPGSYKGIPNDVSVLCMRFSDNVSSTNLIPVPIAGRYSGSADALQNYCGEGAAYGVN